MFERSRHASASEREASGRDGAQHAARKRRARRATKGHRARTVARRCCEKRGRRTNRRTRPTGSCARRRPAAAARESSGSAAPAGVTDSHTCRRAYRSGAIGTAQPQLQRVSRTCCRLVAVSINSTGTISPAVLSASVASTFLSTLHLARHNATSTNRVRSEKQRPVLPAATQRCGRCAPASVTAMIRACTATALTPGEGCRIGAAAED